MKAFKTVCKIVGMIAAVVLLCVVLWATWAYAIILGFWMLGAHITPLQASGIMVLASLVVSALRKTND